MTQLIGLLCPKCLKQVWINNGDPTDCTGFDVEAVCCAYCYHIFPVDENEDVDLENCYVEDSYRTPNEATGYE